jgi:hypothetical protein
MRINKETYLAILYYSINLSRLRPSPPDSLILYGPHDVVELLVHSTDSGVVLNGGEPEFPRMVVR